MNDRNTARCAALNPSSLFTLSTKFKLPTAIASDHGMDAAAQPAVGAGNAASMSLVE
ncbi:MAG TPA: hypothetical protein VHK27_11480 [Gammaproteobacteria bacterium]|nr:hypothetical protein [Gammaproteobacteria bacterium]